MKHIAIVAPHFVPSNLTGVHRARLLVPHLPALGWHPTIITVHEKYYEESLDWDLCKLIPEGLDIRRAKAIPTKPLRVVGDIGVRGFWGMYCEIKKLHREKKIDFLYITIPSNYAALLGPLCHRCLDIPYGIDYIDPWVHRFPGTERLFSKAYLTMKLAEILEPVAVAQASLISGVDASYFEDVLKRNPDLNMKAIKAAMPYGFLEKDYDCVRAKSPKAFLFPEEPDVFNLIYAGAMLPNGFPILEVFLEAVTQFIQERKGKAVQLHVWFVGTGKSPDDASAYNVMPYIKKYGLEEYAHEHPSRLGYVDVLNHLQKASAVLVLGSTDSHYTPSKIFQAILSKRPVLALLHKDSSAGKILNESRAGIAVTFSTGMMPRVEQVKSALEWIVENEDCIPAKIRFDFLENFSSKRSAETLVNALDQIIL